MNNNIQNIKNYNLIDVSNKNLNVEQNTNFKRKLSNAICASAREVEKEIASVKKEAKKEIKTAISGISVENPKKTTKVDSPKTSEVVNFNLNEAKEKIGNYEIKHKNFWGNDVPKEMPPISNASLIKLFAGCSDKPETKKREIFLEKLHEHLESGNLRKGVNREITTLKELLGNNKDLLKAYKDAVKEEAASKSFREGVFIASSIKLDINPCPGKKMVRYDSGPSAAGKSYLSDEFDKQVSKRLNPRQIKTDKPCYKISVDGGKERELCQTRQMVLQAATKNGYGGISDLHKHTKTGVKGKVLKAAMHEGENFHVVIPATFISGLPKFSSMMRKLANDPEIFQVFTEVRADRTGPRSQEEAMQSFQQTIVYNGESRAYLQPGQENNNLEFRMNNTNIGCESKVYERKYFELGVKFSEMGKKAFKAVTNDKNSMILSNESDNMHIKKDENGNWVQTTEKPMVIHISLREVNLWNEIGKKGNIKEAFMLLNTEKDLSGQYETFKNALENGRKEKGNSFDLPDLLKLLKEMNLRSNVKIT
jgi:hypothetical protein